MNDPSIFVKVLNRLNVDEYSQRYVVILLLDVILFLFEIKILHKKNLLLIYQHHPMQEIHVQPDHGRLLYMLYKL